MAVTSEEVAAYQSLVESQARRFASRPFIEFDDLVQEGLIVVWRALDRGLHPGVKPIQDRMKNWVRFIERQRRGETDVNIYLPFDV